MTTDQNPSAEADADTVANRAAQVITRMGADIRALTGERDRYRTAWRSARERAQAYGEGILRVVKEREQYQQWLKQAEERGAAVSVPPPADQTALRAAVAEALLDHLSRTADIRSGRDGALAFMPEVTDAERMRITDAVLAVLPEQADRAAEMERMRERHKASLRRADQMNNELMEEVQRYAAGTERPVLWSVYNEMHKRALTAEARAESMERHDDGIDTGPGIIVRRRIEPAVGEQPAETRQSCACGQDGCEYCDVDEAVGEQPETQETP